MAFNSGVSFVSLKPSSCALITMLLRPARSLMSTRALVADQRGLDVLVAASELLHGVDVHAALVRKRR